MKQWLLPHKGMTTMKVLFVSPLFVASGVWSLTALWIDGPASRGIAGLLLIAFALAALLVVIRVRPFWRAAGVYSLLFACVLFWWLTLVPSNNRDWQQDLARLPKATIAGNLLTIENIRNFDYRSETDYDAHWETRTYDHVRNCPAESVISQTQMARLSSNGIELEYEEHGAADKPLVVLICGLGEQMGGVEFPRGFCVALAQCQLRVVRFDNRDVGLSTHLRHRIQS